VVENLLSVGGVVVKINKNALANFSDTKYLSFVSGKKLEFSRMETQVVHFILSFYNFICFNATKIKLFVKY